MLIPILIVRDMAEAVLFHTRVLDFALAYPMPPDMPFYQVLTRGPDELHLQLAPGQSHSGHGAAIILCDDVDALFASFRGRGLPISGRADSPVHQGPLEQSWGTREVYIDDPSGNTLIFQQRR